MLLIELSKWDYWHDFILCGTQSTKNTPTRYKTYAIVGVVPIPTYKKWYADTIFEFSENNGASQKKFFTIMSRSCVLLTFWFRYFFYTSQVPRHSCFLKKMSAPSAKRLRIEKTKKNHSTMVQACPGLYCRLLTVCLSVHPGRKIVKYHNKPLGAWSVDKSAVGWKGGYVCGDGNLGEYSTLGGGGRNDQLATRRPISMGPPTCTPQTQHNQPWIGWVGAISCRRWWVDWVLLGSCFL